MGFDFDLDGSGRGGVKSGRHYYVICNLHLLSYLVMKFLIDKKITRASNPNRDGRC